MAPKADTKTMIETSDMSKAMKEYVIKFVEPLVIQQMNEEELAIQIREHLDKHYNGGWNVIVGKEFAAYVQHDPGTLCMFYVDRIAIMIFKAK